MLLEQCFLIKTYSFAVSSSAGGSSQSSIGRRCSGRASFIEGGNLYAGETAVRFGSPASVPEGDAASSWNSAVKRTSVQPRL